VTVASPDSSAMTFVRTILAALIAISVAMVPATSAKETLHEVSACSVRAQPAILYSQTKA